MSTYRITMYRLCVPLVLVFVDIGTPVWPQAAAGLFRSSFAVLDTVVPVPPLLENKAIREGVHVDAARFSRKDVAHAVHERRGSTRDGLSRARAQHGRRARMACVGCGLACGKRLRKLLALVRAVLRSDGRSLRSPGMFMGVGRCAEISVVSPQRPVSMSSRSPRVACQSCASRFIVCF